MILGGIFIYMYHTVYNITHATSTHAHAQTPQNPRVAANSHPRESNTIYKPRARFEKVVNCFCDVCTVACALRVHNRMLFAYSSSVLGVRVLSRHYTRAHSLNTLQCAYNLPGAGRRATATATTTTPTTSL